MGNSSDRLAAKFGVSRAEQDEFTVLSHTRAAKAHADGMYADEIIPVDGKTVENGIKGDTTFEKVGVGVGVGVVYTRRNKTCIHAHTHIMCLLSYTGDGYILLTHVHSHPLSCTTLQHSHAHSHHVPTLLHT